MSGTDSPLESSKSSDSIEMLDLENIAITPDSHHRHDPKQDMDDSQDRNESDDEEDPGDGGSRALLGSRGRDSAPVRRSSAWIQVKTIVVQTGPTLLVTTVGLLFTGQLLSDVSHWKAMTRVDELLIIIPVVLNLKGNLEMNLSSRLGTSANIGELDKPDTRRKIILGNLTILQVQAALVSFVAACVSFLLGRITPKGSVDQPIVAAPANTTALLTSMDSAPSPHQMLVRSILQVRKPRPPVSIGGTKISGLAEFIMVASAAMCSTAISSIVLGSFMCTLIVLCRKFGLDPDNIAPPVAGCLGDLVTLTILGFVAVLHVQIVDTPIPSILVAMLTCMAIGWIFVARRNTYVKDLLTQGWPPLFAAMIISSCTGVVLDTFVSRYQGFALLAVVITGLPGSVGSVFVSRLSTALHAAAAAAEHLSSSLDHRPHPSPRLAMFTLLAISFPIQIIFLCLVYAFGWLHLPIVFVILEVIFFCITVAISLFLAQIATNFLWSRKLDPDMYAMPLHSAFMDLVGQLLLVSCYELASLFGSKVRSKAIGQPS